MLKKLSISIVLFVAVTACALVSETGYAEERGFNSAASNLQQGMVVRQAEPKGSRQQIEPASREDGSNVVGITVDVQRDPELAGQSGQVVLVENQGEVVALVTNAGGDIAIGDKLTLSEFPGVLTKLTDPANGVVFATAKEAFNPARSQTLQLEGGPVTVTSITVEFGQAGSVPTDPATTGLRQFGEGIKGRDLSEVRLLFAFLLSFAVVVVTSVIVYGAIANALYSVGRNPLAKKIILTSMAKIVAIALLILALGLAAAYLILTI